MDFLDSSLDVLNCAVVLKSTTTDSFWDCVSISKGSISTIDRCLTVAAALLCRAALAKHSSTQFSDEFVVLNPLAQNLAPSGAYHFSPAIGWHLAMEDGGVRSVLPEI